MAEKNEVRVLVKGQILTLSGYEPVEYQQKLAMYINDKFSECEKTDSFRFLTSDKKSILLELNLADDYFKAKSHQEVLEQDIADKNNEINRLMAENEELLKKLTETKGQVAELQENVASSVTRIMQLETEAKKNSNKNNSNNKK